MILIINYFLFLELFKLNLIKYYYIKIFIYLNIELLKNIMFYKYNIKTRIRRLVFFILLNNYINTLK